MLHQIEKTSTGYICQKCGKTFKGKPKSDSCPGVFIYEDWESIPNYLKTKPELKLKSLFPMGGSLACIVHGKTVYYLYDINETIPCPIPIYAYPKQPPELKTVEELKKLNLGVNDRTPVRGLMWTGYYLAHARICTPYFHKLYDPKDCHFEAQDNYLAKGTLKSKYLLSEGWIKRIGKPDLILDNPHYKHGSDMKLYSRFRVEKFLADNAEEYAKWISRRTKLSILCSNNEGLQRYHETKKEEEREKNEKDPYWQHYNKCSRCKSGISTKSGFLCVIHPIKQPLPCPDFKKR